MKRETKQTVAIKRVLAVSARPLSVNEIHEMAQREVAGIGIATIYRNLKSLQNQGDVRPVEVPGQAPRWESVPAHHHHHFLCLTCDRLFEIQECPVDLDRLVPEGYVLEGHDILLRGQCRSCSKKKKKTVL